MWEDKTYGDVGPDMEFIVGDYVYGTIPKDAAIFLKPELDITKLVKADQAFGHQLGKKWLEHFGSQA